MPWRMRLSAAIPAEALCTPRDLVKVRNPPRRGPSHSGPVSTNMQEEWQPLPPATCFRGNRMLRNTRLAQCLHQEPARFQRQKVGFERTMLAVECHCPAVSLDRVRVTERSKIVPLHNERRIGNFVREMSGRIDRMDDR